MGSPPTEAPNAGRVGYNWRLSTTGYKSKTVQDWSIISIIVDYEVVCALSNGNIADDLEWPLTTQTTTISTFCVAFHIFVAGNRRDFKFGMWVEHSKSQPTDDKPWSSLNFKVPDHIPGITEARIAKFRTHVHYTKCYEKDDILPLNGRGYDHMMVFTFCRLPWCSASRGFVRNSWYLLI